ncbi:hypothetical protein LMG27952_06905 [Paraburkholderia hiiakae]|uniref:Uncharacterized protein n=1 Tax=Paraburkholderia hiiakae TaxID=1081782 RepID=A0ABM8P955_9BURK|nr:hypothetical protein LMG27952_06905 [Paraburkholderia hiiakae]
MLGINRIVITDGHINAKVVFDMRASDTAGRVSKASLYDLNRDTSTTSASVSTGGWFNPIQAGISTTQTSDHMTTVSATVDDTSESKARVKAQLSGEVRVNFKTGGNPAASARVCAARLRHARPVGRRAVAGATLPAHAAGHRVAGGARQGRLCGADLARVGRCAARGRRDSRSRARRPGARERDDLAAVESRPQ